MLRDRRIVILPGQYFDQEGGLNFNYHRYYDPSIGRYLRSDPIGLAGDVNTYAYAASNPVRYVDPLGLDAFIGFYSGGQGNPFAHAGIGINTEATIGLYPKDATRMLGYMLGLPGEVRPDDAKQLEDMIRIPTTAEQDRAMKDAIQRISNDPNLKYRVLGGNCTDFVRRVLAAAGMQYGCGEVYPSRLQDDLLGNSSCPEELPAGP